MPLKEEAFFRFILFGRQKHRYWWATTSWPKGCYFPWKTRTFAYSTEEDYFTIISNKTASLLASACAAGAYTASGKEEQVEQMRVFGENTGIAFQIKDDLFDYGTDDVGKPTGNDIREKKLTLPLIYTLKTAPKETKRFLTYTIKNKNKDTSSIKSVIEEVQKAGGIQYAQEKMEQYKIKALEALDVFPASAEKDALAELVKFTTERKK